MPTKAETPKQEKVAKASSAKKSKLLTVNSTVPVANPQVKAIENADKAKGTDKKLLKLKQIKSPIGRQVSQRQTLIGLGLNKLHRVSIVEDTSAVRGMVNAVRHLLKIETD